MQIRKAEYYNDLDGTPKVKDRSKGGIWITTTPEEEQKLEEVCQYLDISRGLFLAIAVESVYERHLMNNSDITADEIADNLGVGYGVVSDITGLY